MFRRKKKTLQENFRNAIWPKMGWVRVFRYYGLKLYRLNDTPYEIAAGLASGVAMALTPFIGLHLILAFFLARLLNGSVLAALIGTTVGNPWTVPLIFFVTYKLGLLILGSHAVLPLPETFTFSSIFTEPQSFLIPMILGSIPCAILAWIGVFFSVRNIITRLQHQRFRRRARARLKEMQRRKKLIELQTEIRQKNLFDEKEALK